MNHELIMLREVKRMRRLSQNLNKEAVYKAVKSHMSATVKGGTAGQIEEICQLIRLRDDCLLFCRAVNDGLDALDANERKLLVQVYVKKVGIDELACKSNTSRSTVYRRLYKARANFRKRLENFGYTAEWFTEVFDKFYFISDMLKTKKKVSG